MNVVKGVATKGNRFIAPVVCAGGCNGSVAGGRVRIEGCPRIKMFDQSESTGARLAAGSRLFGTASRLFVGTYGGRK